MVNLPLLRNWHFAPSTLSRLATDLSKNNCSFSFRPKPSGFGFAWLIKPTVVGAFTEEGLWKWFPMNLAGYLSTARMLFLSNRGLSFSQSVIGGDRLHFKRLCSHMQIRVLATTGKHMRWGGLWSQGICVEKWPGWYVLPSHFVRSGRRKWKLAVVYFMVCTL